MTTNRVTIDGVEVLLQTASETVTSRPSIGSDTDLELTSAVGARTAEIGADMRTIIRTMTCSIGKALEEASPHEWEVEFAVGFSTTGGMPFLASAAASGSIKVTAKWRRS